MPIEPHIPSTNRMRDNPGGSDAFTSRTKQVERSALRSCQFCCGVIDGQRWMPRLIRYPRPSLVPLGHSSLLYSMTRTDWLSWVAPEYPSAEKPAARTFDDGFITTSTALTAQSEAGA